MIELYEVEITKNNLALMPKEERQLLLLLGHAVNEINVFQKLILMSNPDISQGVRLVNKVHVGQYLILIRTLIGKIFEARKMFGVRFLSDKNIKNKYFPLLNDTAASSLKYLNKHFGKKDVPADIRNKFSFHYSDEANLIEESFKDVPPDEAWQFCISQTGANSFYYASELVVANGVLQLVADKFGSSPSYSERTAASLEKLMELCTEASNHISVLFNHCIAKIIATNFGDVRGKRMIIDGAPPLRTTRIPFFVETDSKITVPAESSPSFVSAS